MALEATKGGIEFYYFSLLLPLLLLVDEIEIAVQYDCVGWHGFTKGAVECSLSSWI